MKVLPVFLVQCVKGCHQWYSEISLKISKHDHFKQEITESRSQALSFSRYKAKVMERFWNEMNEMETRWNENQAKSHCIPGFALLF